MKIEDLPEFEDEDKPVINWGGYNIRSYIIGIEKRLQLAKELLGDYRNRLDDGDDLRLGIADFIAKLESEGL